MKVNPIMNITGQMPYQKHARKAPKLRRTEANSPWSRYGSDDSFLAFLRLRPSAVSGRYDWNDGVGRCEACHYRHAGNSGWGMKPPYSAIPLTHKEHQMQTAITQYKFMPKERWEYLVEFYLKAWARSTGKPLHWME